MAQRNGKIAEWVLRWEGSLVLENADRPIHDVSQLPPGVFHITSIDLTAAVMHPVELRKLEGLTHLRELSPRAHLESRRRQGRQNRRF